MAINFGDTIIEGGIEPSATVQAPVQDNSGAVLAEALAPAAKVVGAIAGSIFKGSQDDQNAKILTSYENDLLDLADAVDQGAMNRNEAMIKARNLRRQYLSNAPALQDDFDTVWTDFAGASGLGHVVIEGTVAQQAQDGLLKEALSKGYTPDEYNLFLSRARQATEYNHQLETIKAQGGILTETQKLEATKVMIGLADGAFPSAQKQINDAMRAIEANPNPENKAAIVQNLNLVIGQSIAQMDSMTATAEGSNDITAPIKSLMETFNKWADGSIETGVMEGAIKNTQAKYNLMYANDPVLGPIIANAKMLDSVGLGGTTLAIDQWTPEALQRMKQVMDPKVTLNPLDNEEGTARFADNVRQIAGEINSSSDPQLIEEVKNAVNQMIDGTYVNERNAQDGALGFKDVVETLGSAEVGEFIRMAGVDAKYADQFVSVLKNNYENELLPAVDRAWTSDFPLSDPTTIGATGPEGNTAGITNIPLNQLLEPRWNGNAVEFVPQAQYANNPRVIQLANDTTSGDGSIGIPLNNLINAYANVTGVDPKSIYEQDFAGRLFGVSEDGEVASPLAAEAEPIANNDIGLFTSEESLVNASDPNQLSIEDFQPEQLQEIVSQTSASSVEGVMTANNPVEFAQSYIGRSESNAEDVQVLSAFIQRTAGININPAKTAWCAAFVDAVLHASGRGGGTGQLNARSYLNWGEPVSTPQVGDIVVFSRGDPNGWQGHVGFYAGMNADGTIKVLGGNQGNSVNFSDFDASKVLGYRRASNV